MSSHKINLKSPSAFRTIGLFAIFLILCPAGQVLGQEKREKEVRASRKEVPGNARKWLDDAYEGSKKVKWYHEINAGKESYEAKFRWNKQHHSVEFSKDGVIEDIEIGQQWEELPDTLRKSLQAFFEEEYDSHKILKIQRQYTGSPGDLEDLIDEDEMEGISIQYEIEYFGRLAGDSRLWEGLFDRDGSLLRKRKIVQRPADNLDY